MITEAVCEYFGCSSVDELLNDPEFANTVADSVQPSFCTSCGLEGPNLEPDGHMSCECGGTFEALELLIIGGNLI